MHAAQALKSQFNLDITYRQIMHADQCMIKIFWGPVVVIPSKPLPPMNNFCFYPPPCFKMFLERSLNDPHHPTSSIFHCYPLPIYHPFPPPPKNFDHTQVLQSQFLYRYHLQPNHACSTSFKNHHFIYYQQPNRSL